MTFGNYDGSATSAARRSVRKNDLN